jgi:hypothetical protein
VCVVSVCVCGVCVCVCVCIRQQCQLIYIYIYTVIPRLTKVTLDNKFQTILFVSVMNMLLIYLFASTKLENGYKKDYLVLVLKLCITVLFYEIG